MDPCCFTALLRSTFLIKQQAVGPLATVCHQRPILWPETMISGPLVPSLDYIHHIRGLRTVRGEENAEHIKLIHSTVDTTLSRNQ